MQKAFPETKWRTCCYKSVDIRISAKNLAGGVRPEWGLVFNGFKPILCVILLRETNGKSRYTRLFL